MSRTIWWLILVAGLAVLGAIVYYGTVPPARESAPPVAPPLLEPQAVAPAPSPEPAVRYPLPPQTMERPLPALDTSDATMRNTLRELWSDRTVEDRFHLKDFIRRIVVTIDNLPRKKVAQQLMPVRRVDGAFLVSGENEELAVGEQNAARYRPYVMLLESVDPGQLVALYMRFYPLFQQAYEDLGYPRQYFNDRLVAAIDDMLAAPDLDGPVKLVRPKVFYLYADPELEASSAGQKILMRMGPDNAARVKTRLKAIRAELVRQSETIRRAATR
jgi:hypothetical protein